MTHTVFETENHYPTTIINTCLVEHLHISIHQDRAQNSIHNKNNLLPSHFTCIMIVLSLRDLFGHDIQPRYLSLCFLIVCKQFV